MIDRDTFLKLKTGFTTFMARMCYMIMFETTTAKWPAFAPRQGRIQDFLIGGGGTNNLGILV